MSTQPAGHDLEAIRRLLTEFPDAPVVVIFPPLPGNRLPRTLQTTVGSLQEASSSAVQPVVTPPHDANSQPSSEEVHGRLAAWQVRRLSAYIDEHLSGPLHVQDLAAITRLSLGHFAHAFKQTFGEPPLAHITRRRLARACARMLAGDEPLSHIAQECGFYDQSHFTRHFHRTMGMAPQRWRRQHTSDSH